MSEDDQDGSPSKDEDPRDGKEELDLSMFENDNEELFTNTDDIPEEFLIETDNGEKCDTRTGAIITEKEEVVSKEIDRDDDWADNSNSFEPELDVQDIAVSKTDTEPEPEADTSESLPEEATAEVIPQALEGDQVLHRLLKAAKRGSVEEMCSFGRKFGEIEYDKSFKPIVARIHEITKKYRSGGIQNNLGTIPDDLLELGALMVSLSEPLGFLEGVFEDADECRKLALAGFYLEAKRLKEQENFNVTDKDAEHVGRVLSHKYIKNKGEAAILMRQLRNLWYGLRHLIDILDGSLKRAGSEMKRIEQAEGVVHRYSPQNESSSSKEENEPEVDEDGVVVGEWNG